jgi:hypothetical protein
MGKVQSNHCPTIQRHQQEDHSSKHRETNINSRINSIQRMIQRHQQEDHSSKHRETNINSTRINSVQFASKGRNQAAIVPLIQGRERR